MDFTNQELEIIKFALEYLHEADLSSFDKEDIKTIENLMDKFKSHYVSQLFS